ncbi:MAG: hypothetical protein HQ504_00665 [Rhodospirillaceae bacterium]|nr:hypothetical protein [Rhodospirillaceae bacterium]
MASHKALILAAHGSSNTKPDNLVSHLAENIHRRNLFSEVTAGFLIEEPLLGNVIGKIKSDDIIVVPVTAAKGYVTDHLIPRAIDMASTGKSVIITEPVGTHALIAKVMARHVDAIAAIHHLAADDTSLVIVAHGNPKHDDNARQARSVGKSVAALAAASLGSPPRVTNVFIDQEPALKEWSKLARGGNLIILPLLIGGGRHGVDDLRGMLELPKTDPAFQSLGDVPYLGPLDIHGRKVWCCRAVGNEPEIADIVVERAGL